MKIQPLNKKVYLLHAKSKYEVASAFMRFQEFYESPFKQFRKKWFDHEEYMDRYAAENGNFTYTSDWSGFNIPGHIFQEAISTFSGDTWRKEERLIELVDSALDTFQPKKYYIIGCCETYLPLQVCAHEIAHAMWYLYPKYKKEQKENMLELSYNTDLRISKALLKAGYNKAVIPDEIQAYISTSSSHFLIKKMNFPRIAKSKMASFENTFRKYLKETGLQSSLEEWAEQLKESHDG